MASLSFIAEHIETGGPGSIRLSEVWSEAVFFLPSRRRHDRNGHERALLLPIARPRGLTETREEVRSAFVDADEINGG